MLKTLRARNVALLVGVLMAGQILSFALIWALAIRPQAERVGAILARNVAAISMTMDAVPTDERAALIAHINRDGAIRILPGTVLPPEDRGTPTLLERLFMRAFVREMKDNGVILWQGGQNGQMWARVTLGGTAYWMANERPKGWSPNGAMLASFLIALGLAMLVGILLQRRLSRPLQALAKAADSLGYDARPAPLSPDGPAEIAAVARSFNRMSERLAAQESERTFMLAGISHDLRTPLAKLRLALALVPKGNADTEALIERQLDQIDRMLAQFLDFARGVDNEAPVPVDLRTIADTAIATANLHGVTVTTDGPVTMIGLPIAITRAVTNLLRNAALHGRPPISLSINNDQCHVTICVTDSGGGIPPEKLAGIDQPFVRGDQARPSDGGTGLGLAIARHLAEAHSGQLILENVESGRGFHALIRFPMK